MCETPSRRAHPIRRCAPTRVVVTSDMVGSGKHWSRSDCRANNPVAGKARHPLRKGKCCPIFVLGVPGLVAEPADKWLVTEDQRSLAFVSQFLLVSGLVRNRRSGISVPRAFPIYTGWCPLAKNVPPLDRNRLSGDVVTNRLYSDFDLVSFKDPCSLSNHMLVQLVLSKCLFAETAR